MKRCPVCGDFDNMDDWCNHCDIPYAEVISDRYYPKGYEPEPVLGNKYPVIWFKGEQVVLLSYTRKWNQKCHIGRYLTGSKQDEEVIITQTYYDTYYQGETIILPF